MSDNRSIHQDPRAVVQETGELYQDACTIIEQARAMAYRAVNEVLIKRNWLLGMRIQREVLKDKRAEYGEQVVKNLAMELTNRYGKGFSMRNLYNFVVFFQQHPNFSYSVSGKSESILQAATAKSQESFGLNIFQSLIGKFEIVPSLTGQTVSILESFRLQNS